MYCSIQEAWPEHNFFNNINNTSKTEPFNNISKPISSNRELFMENNINSVINKNDKRPEFFNNYSHPTINNHQISNQEKHSVNNEIVEKYNNSQYNCHNFLEHLENCSECQKIISNRYKSNNLTEIFKANPQLKETIVVFLLGLLIIMILNLLYK